MGGGEGAVFKGITDFSKIDFVSERLGRPWSQTGSHE